MHTLLHTHAHTLLHTHNEQVGAEVEASSPLSRGQEYVWAKSEVCAWAGSGVRGHGAGLEVGMGEVSNHGGGIMSDVGRVRRDGAESGVMRAELNVMWAGSGRCGWDQV